MTTSKEEHRRWETHAEAVTIVRDDWGIAHIRGVTDADAVFGLIYAQAEDDFGRIENNYLTALGRVSEAEGESAVYQDLRVRLFVNFDDLKRRYEVSPQWLKTLMSAWADGLNFYLARHPQVIPRAITRFEPWMALSFVEGAILGDIGRVRVDELEDFYRRQAPTRIDTDRQSSANAQECFGSNAFAVAPSNTRNGRALLLINPHPDFYFRAEVHVQSDEGLNCYGAVTWGQFFVYQGFNERLGWGLTTSGADAVDEYAESIVERGGRHFYRHADVDRPVESSEAEIQYRTASGALSKRHFTIYRTHHGPIVREAEGRWVSLALMYKPVEALMQSFLRMKTRSYAEFLDVMRVKANSVTNTVYADAEGNIAYLHPQFIPRRDDRFDFTVPVDGADPAADWKDEHAIEEMPNLLNPATGWIANTNNAAYCVAGDHSPRSDCYPRYMDTAGENPRGLNAALLLKDRKDFTLDSLAAMAYNRYLTTFARLVPGLLAAYDEAFDARKHHLSEQIAVLRAWDCCSSTDSVATSLAVFWGEEMFKEVEPVARTASVEMASMFDYVLRGLMSPTVTFRALNLIFDYMADRATPAMKLNALAKASDRLVQEFGTWRVVWGEINRFQRLTADIVQTFDDAKPSTPVPATSSIWGSLACFKARRHEKTNRRYGTAGNGFVAAVEFGRKVKAIAVSAGGASGNPNSPHFNDQGARFITGELRDVYFYPEQLLGHVEQSYRPGERNEAGSF